MINRENWLLSKAYLKYRKEVDQVSHKTLRLEKTWLNHLLLWANSKAFVKAPKIRPIFPEYILNVSKSKTYSREYIRKVISSAKRFFEWVSKNQSGYRTVFSPGWLDTLKTPRLQSKSKEHEHVTLEEIYAMAQAPVYSLRDERVRAAAVFWFLSGIRIGAFVSLPISAINLTKLSVNQWPELGVQTKNMKHATTYLLDIPELLQVVKDWDFKIKKHIPEESFWFAPLSPVTGGFDATIQSVGNHRSDRARKDLKEWLKRVRLPYHSPHKFRHGNAVYSIKHSKDVSELKAISQNLMHSNLSITDGVYGILSNDDVGNAIKSLGKIENKSNNDLVIQLENILAEIKKSK